MRRAENFEAFVSKITSLQGRAVKRGDLSRKQKSTYTKKLNNVVLPAFGDIHTSNIDYTLVDDFIDEMKQDRGLAVSTLKQYENLTRKVSKEAERDRAITL